MLRATTTALSPMGGLAAGGTRARVTVRGKTTVAQGVSNTFSATVSSRRDGHFVNSAMFKNMFASRRGTARTGDQYRAPSHVTNAASPAMPSDPVEGEDPYFKSKRLYPHLDLDFTPKLTIPALISCVVTSWAAVIAYATFHSNFHLRHYTLTLKPLMLEILSFAVVGAAAFWVIRNVLEEMQEQSRLLSVEKAADEDSMFASIDGLSVHYKKREPTGNTKNASEKTVVSCVHGFGANTYSWERESLQPLAESLGAVAVAHDSPGFGLTERSSDLSRYTARTNAAISRAMLDLAEGNDDASTSTKTIDDVLGKMATADDSSRDSSRDQKSKTRRIIVGHSMGGVAAAIAAAEGDVDDVILVAPAVIAADTSGSDSKATSGGGIVGSLTRIIRVIVAFVASPVLKFALRKLVRSVTFWRNGLARAVGQVSQQKMQTDATWADGYRRPSAVSGWDTGMVRGVLAAATGGVNGVSAFLGKQSPNASLDKPENIVKALNESKARVLIVHGSDDFIVPVSNSEKLAQMMPKAQLVVMPGVGHMPHEEDAAKFLDAVKKFIDAK